MQQTLDNLKANYKLGIPALLIAVSFMLISVIPHFRDCRDTHVTIEQTNHAITLLSSRLDTYSAIPTVEPTTNTSEDTLPSNTSRTRSCSAVRSSAQLMTILESQSIDVMESASVVNSDADSSENGQKQRVTLLGSFTSVLQALQLVESQLPGALAEELKMVRTTPTDICRWEVEFRFNGVAH